MSGETSNIADENLQIEKNLAGTFSLVAPRALIIDDNSANIRLLSQQLNFLGCQVDSGNSGAAGLELWRLHEHQIVIVDCHMPGMDGKEVIRYIVNSSAYEPGRHNIIGYSADTSELIRDEYVNVGADYFAVKPMALLNLYKLLSQCIDKSAVVGNEILAFAPEEFDVATAVTFAESTIEIKSLVEVKIVNVDYIYEILGDDPCRQETHKLLAELFSKEAPRVLSDMIAVNEQHDTVKLGHLVHKFKSSARSVGADRVAAICVSLEELIPSYKHSEIAEILSGFEGYLQEVEDYWASKIA